MQRLLTNYALKRYTLGGRFLILSLPDWDIWEESTVKDMALGFSRFDKLTVLMHDTEKAQAPSHQ